MSTPAPSGAQPVPPKAPVEAPLPGFDDLIAGMSAKRKRRAQNLVLAARGLKRLNGITRRALAVLHRDGLIDSRITGNLALDLLSRPYSITSVRAMGVNTISVLRELGVVLPAGKCLYRANPESVLLGLLG